jgi:hypothetical protein
MGSIYHSSDFRFSRRKLLKGSVAAAAVVSPIFSSACSRISSLFTSEGAEHQPLVLPSWQSAGVSADSLSDSTRQLRKLR